MPVAPMLSTGARKVVVPPADEEDVVLQRSRPNQREHVARRLEVLDDSGGSLLRLEGVVALGDDAAHSCLGSHNGVERRSRGLAGRERQRGGQECAAAGRALDFQPPTERGRAVAQPDQTVPIGIGASDPVVTNLDVEQSVLHGYGDLGMLRVRRA